MFLVGSYRVVSAITGGSLGYLYEGQDQLGRRVAIKSVAVSGGLDVIAALCGLILSRSVSHRGVLNPIDVLPVSGGLVIVSDLVVGGSLADLLTHQGALPVWQVARGAALVSDALASLHRARVVHGDLKPANILLRPGGAPLITDSGLGACLGEVADWPVIPGTVDYLSPELRRGGAANAASDVFALGVICWEALVGQRPPLRPLPPRAMRSSRWGGATSLSGLRPDVPECLVAAVTAALSRCPLERPTADQMTTALTAALPRCGRASQTGARNPPVRAGAGRLPIRLTVEGLPETVSPVPLPTAARGIPDASGGRRDWGRPRPRWALGLGSVAVAVTVTVVVLATVLFGRTGPRPARPGAEREAGVASIGPTVPTLAPGPADLTSICGVEHPAATVETLVSDVFGSGCVRLSWSDGVLTVGSMPDSGSASWSGAGSAVGRSFVMGRAGDELLLGDWDCRGFETPALYRPSTGQVFEWGTWASPGHDVSPATVTDTGIEHGIATVAAGRRDHGSNTGSARGGGDCDRVSVRSPGGSG